MRAGRAPAGALDPIRIARSLIRDLEPLRFGPPVAIVYNPLAYAWQAHLNYVKRYGLGPRGILLVGMNPGPWGMAQTGVPFGEVRLVRDWLGIDAPVGKPEREHPKRPVLGFACGRSEVSGARLWGWARDEFRTPERFFSHFFVVNYCPLLFLRESGKNLTPDQLPAEERKPLLEACDRALKRLARYYRPSKVIGIGGFAQARAREALAGTGVAVGGLLHPSPANPKANRGWAKEASRVLGAIS